MNPEPDPKLDALFAQARARRADTSKAEYAFETRLMARIRTGRPAGSVWATVSWRMMPFFAVLVLTLAYFQIRTEADFDNAEQTVYLNNVEVSDPAATTLDL